MNGWKEKRDDTVMCEWLKEDQSSCSTRCRQADRSFVAGVVSELDPDVEACETIRAANSKSQRGKSLQTNWNQLKG